MSKIYRLVLAVVFTYAASASAMSVSAASITDYKEPPKLLETVTVDGGSTSIPASQAELLRIADLFRTMKARFSPEASLRFRLSSRDAQLTLSKDDVSTDVLLDEHRTFDLASIPVVEGSYFYSSEKGSKIRPFVRSTLDDTHFRIGDLRLECELTWELIRSEAPFKVKMYLATQGGWCAMKKLTWTYENGKRIAAAEIRDGNRIVPAVITRNGMAAIVPIQDARLSNNAVLMIKNE